MDEGTVNFILATFTTLASVSVQISEVQVPDINPSGADLSSVIVSDGGFAIDLAGCVYGEWLFAHSEGHPGICFRQYFGRRS